MEKIEENDNLLNLDIEKVNFQKEKYQKILKVIFIIIMILIIIDNKHICIFMNFTRTEYPEYRYIKRKYGHFMNEIPYFHHTNEFSKTIFWCWFQGLEEAPKLYLSCLNSIKINCKDYKIIIINETNIFDYADFPPYILQKYKEKYITKTHFSDLLRLELLIKHGGTWIDASVLITKYEEIFFNQSLFFFQENSGGCIGSSWFITSERGNPILRTTRDLLYKYHEKNNHLFNYFLFHLFFKMASERYENDIKTIPFYSNTPPHYLHNQIIEENSYLKYNEIKKNISVHKLNMKSIKSMIKVPKNSFFNYIIDEYYPK